MTVVCQAQCTDIFGASNNLMGRGEYTSHFTDEETEALGGQAACPRLLSGGKGELGLTFPCVAPDPRDVLVCKSNV